MQPNFLLIAAPRSGSTSLYHYLDQHPEIQMSKRKEPAYFHFAEEVKPPDFDALARQYGPDLRDESVRNYRRARAIAITGLAEYGNLWTADESIEVRGEATPTYLFDPEAMNTLKETIPQAKVIILLRNPVDRAYSEYLQSLRKGFEPSPDFATAIAREPSSIDDFWWGERSYLRTGLYADHLQRCFNLIGKDNSRIYLYEDFAFDPRSTLRSVASFLGVDPLYEFDTSARHKPSFVPAPTLSVRLARQEHLRRFARKLIPRPMRSQAWRSIMGRRQLAQLPPLDEPLRQRLNEFFAPNIRRVQDLIDRDLSAWTSAQATH